MLYLQAQTAAEQQQKLHAVMNRYISFKVMNTLRALRHIHDVVYEQHSSMERELTA